jgi:3-oxoacyl-[acyl-carrier protein] reductase
MSDLKGRYAVVTGGARGIGAAVVKRFVAEGAAGVAIWDYDEAAAKETAALYPGGRVLAFRCDVSDRENVRRCAEQTAQAFGRIDILVNNAGICRDALFVNMSEDQWDKVLRTNLNGTYYCTAEVVPGMIASGYGKIVNISSSAAHGNVGQANYSASKAAILGLTKTLARELAAKGITVNAVSPCFIETDMMNGIPEALSQTILRMIPMRRMGTADELAGAVQFLACDDSRFVTGIELPVNGGMFT